MKLNDFIAYVVYCAVCLELVACSSISGSYEEEESEEEYEEHYCYSCSGKSALCREEVYDGKYLTKSPCKTKCFLRVENNELYRGCFDGWLGGLVKYNYEGCKLQKYLGQTVEWCFCTGGGTEGEPCNSQSRESLGGGLLQYSNSINDVADAYDDVYHSFPGSYLAAYRNDDSKGLAAKEGGDDHYKLDCYECHDDFSYCGKHITKPEYIGLKGCQSKCFIRKEEAGVYRGCFDGWMETGFVYNYNGCQKQLMSGAVVELCLCDTQLCNGQAIDEFGEARYTESNDVTSNVQKYAKEGSVSDDRFGIAEAQDNMVYKYTPTRRLSPHTLCRGLTNGVYTDPFDCTMYVNCLNGFTYRRRCPPGTAWNVEIGFCDYAHKVVHMCQPTNYIANKKLFDEAWIVDEDKTNLSDNDISVSEAPSEVYKDYF